MHRCSGTRSGRAQGQHISDFRVAVDSGGRVEVYIDTDPGHVRYILPEDALLDITHQMVSAQQRLNEIKETT
jgi:hypothetical protein